MPKKPRPTIGRSIRIQRIDLEYLQRAESDERAAKALLEADLHEQAATASIQAMEKRILAHIFAARKNIRHEDFLRRAKSHRLDELITLLIETIEARNPKLAARAEELIREHVLQGARFGDLHNRLRYPMPGWEGNRPNHQSLRIGRNDALWFLGRLRALKKFLTDIDRFITKDKRLSAGSNRTAGSCSTAGMGV